MKYSLIIIFTLITFLSFSQDEVKKNVYKGNIFYHDSEFEDAQYYYEKAVSESGFNYKANFNLANTLVRLKEYDKAIETYKKIADYTNTGEKKAKIFHNIGNTHMYALQKASEDKTAKTDDLVSILDDAIESYKTALRVNPRDEETRYNLAYALEIKKKLDEQQKQEQKEKSESDEKKDSDDEKDGEKGEEKDNNKSEDNKDGDKSEEENDKEGDKSDNEKEPEKDGDENDEKESDGKPKEQQQKISPEQAKRILEAAEKAEKEIQNKLNKQKVIVGEKGKTGTKKDW